MKTEEQESLVVPVLPVALRPGPPVELMVTWLGVRNTSSCSKKKLSPVFEPASKVVSEGEEHWRGKRWRIQNRKWWWITFTFSCPFSGGALVLFFFLYSWAPFLRHDQTFRVSQSNSVSLTFAASLIVLANACLCSLPGLFFFFLGAFWWEEQTSISFRCLCSLVRSLTINSVTQKASELTQWYKGKVRWRYGTK